MPITKTVPCLDAVKAKNQFDEISALDCEEFKVTYAVGRTLDFLSSAIKLVGAEERKVLAECAEVDGQGNPKRDKDTKEIQWKKGHNFQSYQQLHDQTLMDVEIEVQVYPLKLSEAFEHIEGLKAKHIGHALWCFIDDMADGGEPGAESAPEKPARKKAKA